MGNGVGVSAIEVIWVPLGAGATGIVRWSGIAYEKMLAVRQHRPAAHLFHAALRICVDDDDVVVEMGPRWSGRGPGAITATAGPVGARWLGRSRWFSYEIRRTPHGWLPDAEFAVARVLVSTSRRLAADLLDLLPRVPRLTWGRDERNTGEMWNSNSVVSWLLTTVGLDAVTVAPPVGGRAPGWSAGVTVARAASPVRARL
jgi:hypothetical protein